MYPRHIITIAVTYCLMGIVIGMVLGYAFFPTRQSKQAPLGGVPTWQGIGNQTWDALP